MSQGRTDDLLVGATAAPTVGPACKAKPANDSSSLLAIQATLAGTGAVTATVTVEVSNTGNANEWILAGTINLSGTTTATDGFSVNAPWAYIRSSLTAVSGTNATANVKMAY